MLIDDVPEGALSMAATSVCQTFFNNELTKHSSVKVERAFRMWSTGDFIKPMKANGVSSEGFTAAWTERTALYLSDVETLPAKTWKKIISAALKIVESEKKGAVSKPASQATARRHQIVDADESD
jgi:hypothetical protein